MRFLSVVKPTHICNLACAYCYNDDVRDPIMKPETLDRVISQSIQYTSKLPSAYDTVEFLWHGGEPSMTPSFACRKNIALTVFISKIQSRQMVSW